MAILTTEALNKMLDELVHAMVLAEGDNTAGSGYPNGYGVGTEGGSSGAAGRLQQILTDLGAESDASIAGAFQPTLARVIDDVSAIKLIGRAVRRYLGRLNSHARQYGGSNFSSIETWLTYLNTGGGGPWAGLQDQRWRDLYYQFATAYPSVHNVYCEVLQGTADERRHLYTNALYKVVFSGAGAGTPTDGVQIDSTQFAGGVPALIMSGLSGLGSITITGTFFNPSTGAIETGKTAVFSVAANGRHYRAAGGTAHASALILGVDSASLPAGITAGTFYIEAERPALRVGTAQAGAATTITLDAGASSIDDFYNGLQIGHSGDRYTWRTITDYVGSTRVATVNAAWATNPTSSDTFRVLRKRVV
jgi:hypothetical protein